MNNTSNDAANAAAAGIAGVAILVYVLFIVAIIAFTIWVYWRIFQKAGMNGALSLLNLVPIGSIVVICILAFSEWPIERELKALRAATGGNPQIPPGNPPVGGMPMTTT